MARRTATTPPAKRDRTIILPIAKRMMKKSQPIGRNFGLGSVSATPSSTACVCFVLRPSDREAFSRAS
ncbi:MAG: hypothetical protein FWD31_10825 [Planctomycetaceae bacterium]|nr:hypothetical protein [Planctomycetaceae bacterium]